jgi:putative ATPase
VPQSELFAGDVSPKLTTQQTSLGAREVDPGAPLAERMRPRTLDEFYGQNHLLGDGKPLRQLIGSGRARSLILWGPPGTGKTTLGRMLADYQGARFMTLSAVLSGVKDIRAAMSQAETSRREQGASSLLFVDEVHRFNKSQQDAFLPYVEDGTILFVGATTENPSFELNSALLSRARVFVLKALTLEDIAHILNAAMNDDKRGLGSLELGIEAKAVALLAAAADGDARRGLSLLEMAADLAAIESGQIAGQSESTQITVQLVQRLIAEGGARRFDKGGDAFYDQISALHKSIRGSNPDAALYWLCRMLDGGCDPLYLARRLTRIASEDVGNADPRALTLCIDAWETQRRLGSPEGELALAQAAIYMACVPKSNAVYAAFNAAMRDVRELGSLVVPEHLRNAPTALMKELGHGEGYRYAHDESEGYAAGESYFPDAMADKRYYAPPDHGLETRINERLRRLRELDSAHHKAQHEPRNNDDSEA